MPQQLQIQNDDVKLLENPEEPISNFETIIITFLIICFMVGILYSLYWISFPYKHEIIFWGFLGLIALGNIFSKGNGDDEDGDEEKEKNPYELGHRISDTPQKNNNRQIGYVIDN